MSNTPSGNKLLVLGMSLSVSNPVADSTQDDFVTVLHPRSTGLLFCLRTLLPEIPDLQLLDVTIGYPGVPFGKYPQNW